jgi:hypothetical protein
MSPLGKYLLTVCDNDLSIDIIAHFNTWEARHCATVVARSLDMSVLGGS